MGKNPALTAAPHPVVPQEQIADHLESHNDTPPHVLHQIAHQQPGPDEFHALAEHPNTDEATLRHIHAQAEHYPEHKEKIQNAVLNHQNAPTPLVNERAEKIAPEHFKGYETDHADAILHPKVSPSLRRQKALEILSTEGLAGDNHDPKDLSYGQKHLLNKYITHPDVDKATANELASHPNVQVARFGAGHPEADPKVVKKFLLRPDLDLNGAKKFIKHSEGISGDVINSAWNRFKDQTQKDNHGWRDESIKTNVLDHPNTPKGVLDDILLQNAANKDGEDTDYHSSSDERFRVLKHPNYPLEAVKAAAANPKDPNAQHALAERPDTDESTLRQLDSQHKEVQKYGGMANSLIAHPNYPEDLQLKRVKQSTEGARSVLERNELPESVLKELVNHKNKNVAIDALKHKSVNENVVKVAYQRKMADVSRAASNHPLATPEMKSAKAVSDPKAATQIATHSDDENLLEQIHANHGKNFDVMQALAKNPNTPEGVLNKITDHYHSEEMPKDRWGGKQRLDGLSLHPNLNRDARQKLLFSNPQSIASHENTEPDEFRQHLNILKEGGGNNRDMKEAVEDYANTALKNPNLPEDVAKDIVTGKFGPVRGNSYDSFDHLHANPAFSRDVVKTGLDTPEEFMSERVKSKLASSPKLTSDDILDQFEKHKQSALEARRGDDGHSHAVIKGLMANPNAPKEMIDKILNGKSGLAQNSEIAASAIENPQTTPDDLKKFYTENLDDKHSDKDLLRPLSKRIQEEGLTDHALETTKNPWLVDHLLNDNHANQDKADKFKSILKNTDPQVVEHAIQSHGERLGLNTKDREEMFDALVNHPNDSVKKAAFKHMSEGKKKDLLAKVGVNDPEIIRGLGSESVKDLKINKDVELPAVKAILDHRGVTDQHYSDAIEHSPDAAHAALNRLNNGTGRRSGKNVVVQDNIEDFRKKALDTHPGNDKVASVVVGKTRDPEILKKVLDHADKHSPSVLASTLENPAVKSADIDSLTRHKGEEYEPLFHTLAQNPKSSVKMLAHIADQYPQHLALLAKNPKVASAKVLKTVVTKGDDKAHLNLINNPKVPQGVKEELLKNKRLVFMAHPDQVSNDQLEKYATDPDLKIVRHVVEHKNSSPETIKNAVNHAAKSYDKDVHLQEKAPDYDEKHKASSEASAVLSAAAHRDGLPLEAQQQVAMASPEHAAQLVDNQGKTMSPKVALKAMDAHKEDPDYGTLKKALFGNKGLDNPEIAERLINETKLDEKSGENYTGSRRIADLMDGNEYLGDKHYQQVFDKIKSERGPSYAYGESGGNDNAGLKANDAHLLRTLAKAAPEKVQNELINYPELHRALISNLKLSKDNYGKLVDHLEKNETSWDSDDIEDLIKNPQADTASLDKIYNAIYPADKDLSPRGESAKLLAKSTNISSDVASKLWNRHNNRQVLSNPNLPVKDLETALDKYQQSSGIDEDGLKKIASNPNFRLSMAANAKIDGERRNIIERSLADNFQAHPDDLRQIAETADNKTIRASLIKNSQTPEDVAQKMLDSGKVPKGDMFYSPSIGGKLWRGEKHEFSSVPGVEKGKEVNEATFRPREEKIRQVMGMIPNGGQLDWAEFKKANPSLAGDPIVNRLFTSAPKQKVTRDHADNYLNTMPSKKFHVSYSKWDGIQRHNEDHEGQDHPELVVQLNSGEDQDKLLKADRKLNGLFRFIQSASNYSGHPVNPQSIGWSRVDTSNPDHWFIDEIQSDFNSALSKEIRTAQQGGNTGKMKEFGIEPEESEEAVKKMMDVIHGWEKATMNNIIETAKKHGVKKISIHSGGSKTLVNKGKEAEVTNKYDKIYNKMPEEMGFKTGLYQDLPHHDPKSKLVGKPIWTMDLPDSKDESQPSLFDQKKSA